MAGGQDRGPSSPCQGEQSVPSGGSLTRRPTRRPGGASRGHPGSRASHRLARVTLSPLTHAMEGPIRKRPTETGARRHPVGPCVGEKVRACNRPEPVVVVLSTEQREECGPLDLRRRASPQPEPPAAHDATGGFFCRPGGFPGGREIPEPGAPAHHGRWRCTRGMARRPRKTPEP